MESVVDNKTQTWVMGQGNAGVPLLVISSTNSILLDNKTQTCFLKLY